MFNIAQDDEIWGKAMGVLAQIEVKDNRVQDPVGLKLSFVQDPDALPNS